jgi:hypothetical protein
MNGRFRGIADKGGFWLAMAMTQMTHNGQRSILAHYGLSPNYPYDAYYYDAYDDADAYSSLSFRIRASRLWT